VEVARDGWRRVPDADGAFAWGGGVAVCVRVAAGEDPSKVKPKEVCTIDYR
jgi:hypothetical protein